MPSKSEEKKSETKEQALVRRGLKIEQIPEELGGGTMTIFTQLGELINGKRRVPELRFVRTGSCSYKSKGRGRWIIRRVSKKVNRSEEPGSWLIQDRESGLVKLASGFRHARALVNEMHLYKGVGKFTFVERAILQTCNGIQVFAWIVLDSRTGAWRHFPGEHTERNARLYEQHHCAQGMVVGECECSVCRGWVIAGGKPVLSRKEERKRDARGRYAPEDGSGRVRTQAAAGRLDTVKNARKRVVDASEDTFRFMEDGGDQWEKKKRCKGGLQDGRYVKCTKPATKTGYCVRHNKMRKAIWEGR